MAYAKIDEVLIGRQEDNEKMDSGEMVKIKGPCAYALCDETGAFLQKPMACTLEIKRNLKSNSGDLKGFRIAVASLEWDNKDPEDEGEDREEWPEGEVGFDYPEPGEVQGTMKNTFTYELKRFVVDAWSLDWRDGDEMKETLQMRVWNIALSSDSDVTEDEEYRQLELHLPAN